MTILGINHVNLRTLDIAGTARFYADVLGFRYDGPSEVDGFARNWLYDRSGAPIIHLRELAPAAGGTGAVDHLALSGDDKAAVVARLEQLGIRYAERDNIADGIVQVFVTDPNGVLLELSFARS